MRTSSKLSALAGVAMISTWLVAVATPASAAGPCGSGYTEIASYPITANFATKGYLEVYYSAATQQNCALAVGTGDTYGKKTFKRVVIGLSTKPATDEDKGDFAYYAGPVYVKAPGKCIDVEGYVEDASAVGVSVHCD
ncbi:spore-associated protein A [Nonomuraea antimicrobica]|uniref:Spore-associated protein A n=1 Tax=Nonomuraea antimicrobica TaxID=561173 RepID=A0ABP7DUL0_9ACTN